LAEQIAKRGKADPLETLVVPAEKQERLAQLGGQGRGQAAGGAGQARRGAGRQGAAAGRPARQGSSTQRFGPPDSGQELADLIQRTIAPSTWDVNGGPGTIRYWRPGPALVVRQTSDVHGDVSDFLNQLESMRR
jgi:hypothetical protein